jgi:hypothetical protein
MGIECYASFKVVLGSHWWHRIGSLLLEVVMPVEFYQVPKDGVLCWDELGFRAYCADIARFPGSSVDDAMLHSWHQLFHVVGKIIHRGDEGQAADYALHKIAQRPQVVTEIDPQLFLQFTSKLKEED